MVGEEYKKVVNKRVSGLIRPNVSLTRPNLQSCHNNVLILHDCPIKGKQPQQQEQQHSDLSKEVMTIKAQLLVVVNRLDYVEKKLMMRK